VIPPEFVSIPVWLSSGRAEIRATTPEERATISARCEGDGIEAVVELVLALVVAGLVVRPPLASRGDAVDRVATLSPDDVEALLGVIAPELEIPFVALSNAVALIAAERDQVSAGASRVGDRRRAPSGRRFR